uniref:BRISC and BRCA1-A complex member 1-like isoform X3 n=1 Tax=Diabrotica virgifera virgifera TaxID=50390 RepID=A0A6P7GPU9_DIAVI
MVERIIPIQMEDDDNSGEESGANANGNVNSDTTKESCVENSQEKSDHKESSPNNEKEQKLLILIKPMSKTKDLLENLKKYDVFEERSKFSLPNINVPEKIILVIDRAQDEHCTSFAEANGKYTPLSMLRKSLHLFVNLKHSINKNHEFAIVLLNENTATWALPFTSELRKVNNCIEKITQCEVEDTFNMNLVFEEILPNIKIPQDEIAPPYIIRTIICYGRSYTIPEIKFSEKIVKLLDNPFFICDVLMTHEPVDDSNYCNKIFECLQNIDRKGISYFFPVGRSALRLHNSMAKLLGHGLQRPFQTFHKE